MKIKEALVSFASECASGNINEQAQLRDFSTKRAKQRKKSCLYTRGQDSNAQVGVDVINDEGECWDRSIGRFGLDTVNDKGSQLLDFCKKKWVACC